MKTDMWGREFIIFFHFRTAMILWNQKRVYKLLYFVYFWGYVVTFIFGYIPTTTWSNTTLFDFVRLKVLCIVIFVICVK